MFEQQAGENKFAKLALNAWDHSITKENEVEDLKVCCGVKPHEGRATFR